MTKPSKVIIVPDVHCRTFWKETVLNELEEGDSQIIFLGDYVDGYKSDFEPGYNYQEFGVKQLREIVELKKKYSDRITLLLGNHDFGYINSYICAVRRDWEHYDEISEIFKSNIELFDIACEYESGGKNFFFSHAGICNWWATDFCMDFGINFDELTSIKLNEEFHSRNNGKMITLLGHRSFYRGGYKEQGSIIWADIVEHAYTSSSTWMDHHKCIQVVGHSYLNTSLKIDNVIYCLDCVKVFKLEEGKITEYLNGNEVPSVDKNVLIMARG